MYIIKRFLGFCMLIFPFASAFYLTSKFAGHDVALAIWGGCVLILLYFLIAIVLLFAQPKSKDSDIQDDITYLNSKVSELEIILSDIQKRRVSKG